MQSNGNPSHSVFTLTQQTKAAIDQYDDLRFDMIQNLILSASRDNTDWRQADWWSIMTPREQQHLNAVLETLPKGTSRLFALRLMFCFRHDADV